MAVHNTIVPIQVLLKDDMAGGSALVLRGKSSSCKVFNSSLTKTLYYKSDNSADVTCAGSGDADGFVGPGHIDFVEFKGRHIYFIWVEEAADQVFVQEVW